MPFLAALGPILTAVAAGGTLAATGYELANQPSSSSDSGAKAVQAQQQQQQQALQQQQKAAFVANQPNIQSQTGGSLTPPGFALQTAATAGVPSDLNSIAKYLGLGSGSSSAASAPISGGITGASGQQNQQQNPDLQTLSDLLRT